MEFFRTLFGYREEIPEDGQVRCQQLPSNRRMPMKIQKFPASLLAFTLLSVLSALFILPLQAEESLPESSSDSDGSIQVQLPKQAQPASQVHLGLYEIARLDNGSFVFLPPFEQQSLSWPDLEEPDAAGKLKSMALDLADQIQEQKVPALQQAQCDEQGSVTFSSLEPGLYLLSALEAGTYGFITPELVILPQVDPAGVLQNHLQIIPKVQPLPSLLIQKTDEDHKPITGLSCTFALYEDETASDLILELPADPETGTIQVPLWLGKLCLQEKQAPEGYERSEELLNIEVSGPRSVSINGSECLIEDGVVHLDFVNHRKKEKSAPASTGVLSGNREAWLALLAAAGVLIFLLIRKFKKR